jgi:hypothetical protein
MIDDKNWSKKRMHGRPQGLQLNRLIREDLWQTFDYDGIEYRMPFALMNSLKLHFKFNQDVAEWYKQLEVHEKKQVIRIGLPEEDLNYSDGDFIE